MEDLKLKEELKTLREDINTMLEEGAASTAGVIDEKLLNAIGEFNTKVEELGKIDEDLQKQFDEMAVAMKDYKADEAKKKLDNVDPYTYFKNSLEGNEGFDRYKEHRQSFNMQVKADILVSTLYTGAVIEQDRVAEAPFALPHRQTRVRSLFQNGTTQSDTVSFVRQTAATRSAATVAEAGTKQQSDETLALITETIQVIAHLFDISNQALNDYAQMSSYLQNEGVSGLKDTEDTQILSGDNTGANLNGIITQATTTFAGGTDIATDNDIDTLVKGYWQLRNLNYNPSFIMIPGLKMRDIQLLKDDNSQYLYPNFAPVGLADWAINGAPLVVHNAMPSDTFLIADGSKATIWDREQVNVKFSESHSTNFAENMTTIRVEERMCVAVYRPDAFITATFTAAQATLT